MAINWNEDGIPDLEFRDNPEAWLWIGNAQNFLDEHYREVTKSRTPEVIRYIAEVISTSMPWLQTLTGHRYSSSDTDQTRGHYHG